MTRRGGIGSETERGAAAILFAVFLIALVGMTAMVVDLGYAYYSKQRLQDALDLATIAAARELDGASGYQEAARLAAAQVMNQEYSTEGGFTVGIGCGSPSSPRTANLCIGGYNTTRDNQGQLPPLGQRFRANDAAQDAARMLGEAESPSFFARIFEVDVIDVGATSTAVKAGPPQAQLTIRSTVATLSGGALNQLLGLLGGGVNLSLVGWNNLANVNLNLLGYLDTLILRNGASLNLQAGAYTQVLNSYLTVGEILGAGVEALGANTTAGLALNAVRTATSATVGTAVIRLGDLIGVQTGTPASGLDVNLGVLDFLEGVLVAANGTSALSGDITLSTAGITTLLSSLGGGAASSPLTSALNALAPVTNLLGGIATVKLKFAVIEKPRLSAIGNPELAKHEVNQKTGANAIYVRTAQIRLYLSIDLPVLNVFNSLLNAVAALIAPVVPVLNSVLSLNVVAAVSDLLNLVGALLEGVICLLACDITKSETKNIVDIKILDRGGGKGPGIDIVLDVGGGEAYVTDYDCNTPNGGKRLYTQVNTSVAKLNVGALTNPASVFSSSSFPVMNPLALIDIGTILTTATQRKVCGLLLLKLTCNITSTTTQQPRVAFSGGGIALKLETPLLGNGQTTLSPSGPSGLCSSAFTDPPVVGEAPGYCTYNTNNYIASLRDSLASTKIQAMKPAPTAGVLSNLLFSEVGVLQAALNITNTVLAPIVTLLSKVLDPLLNFLTDFLGLKLNQVDVGANLTCSSGARLVN
ncbi:pilus assembly protein TadG-related protein [Zavarzinia compransoris]|uniref:Putative Flp pilus-assembly TadG-like N-terminal domain-containing protein n=1 Tax=Zavarzinia compransoris TaxID=1264899 RepID=A0A317EAZ9_9PROT|nr:pilus assembly protein TadG-related protein [Zavarzinia compransoris]PWR22365.1 hypothetical protein DKG75_10470 [Zavarzinia compransoris]TDP46867.1 putative Flp pilus-assembly TadE/G-like protein [Zavarzinia compransoris]